MMEALLASSFAAYGAASLGTNKPSAVTEATEVAKKQETSGAGKESEVKSSGRAKTDKVEISSQARLATKQATQADAASEAAMDMKRMASADGGKVKQQSSLSFVRAASVLGAGSSEMLNIA